MTIVFYEITLALEDVYDHTSLIICKCGICLCCFGRDRCITSDDRAHHTTDRFDTKRERRNVKKQNIFCVAGKYICLNCRAESNSLVRVERIVRLLMEYLLH